MTQFIKLDSKLIKLFSLCLDTKCTQLQLNCVSYTYITKEYPHDILL